MKKLITTILVFGVMLLTAANVFADTELDYDYNSVTVQKYGEKEVGVIFDQVLSDTAAVNVDQSLNINNIRKTGSTANNVDAEISISHDSLLDQNVLNIKTTNEPSVAGNAISELKTGQLSQYIPNDSDSTGNSTALHMDVNFETNQVLWFQLFAREGGKIGGSNKNVLNMKALHMRWISGVGTYLYFGNADGANVDNWEEGTENFKVFKEFQTKKWYNLVIVLNDNGSAVEDSIEYYLDDELVFSKVGLNVDFNQNIVDMSITQQANGANTSHIKIANLYTTNLNHASEILADDLTVTEGSQFDLNPTIVGMDSNFLPTFSQYDVEISDETILEYNQSANKFTALLVDEDKTVDVTFKLRSNPLISKTVTVTVEKAVVDVLPTEVKRIAVKDEAIKLITGQTVDLDGLFEVLPFNATDKSLTYAVTDASSDVVSITGSTLEALLPGTKTIEVTSVAAPEVKTTLEVVVLDGVEDHLNQFDIDTVYAEAKPEEFVDGWAARGSGSRIFGQIDMTNDPVFGVVPVINGIGAANAGSSFLVNRTLFADSDLEAGKDYKLTGYVKFDGDRLGAHRGDIKVFAIRESQEGDNIGYVKFSTSAWYDSTLALNHSEHTNGEWVYFETGAINADQVAGADGFQIELVSWNNNLGTTLSFANVGFVEQEDVQFGDFELVLDGETAVDQSASIGDELQYGVKFIPTNASSDFTFESSDETVATVTSEGLVEIVGNGVVEISLTVGADTKKVALTVLNPVTSIVADKDEVTLTPGANEDVNVTITPEDHTDNIEITYSNTGVASATLVDGVLNIVAQSIGEVTITIAVEGSEIKETITVTVQDVEVTGIDVKVGTDTVTSHNGEVGSEVTLVTSVLPVNRVDKTVTFTSSDDTVVTVDATGKLNLLKAGTATITLKAGDFEKEFVVTVTEAVVNPTELNVDKTTITLEVNESEKITATLLPANADGSIAFKSSNSAVATVDASGNVKAISAGTATITVSVGELSKTVTVTVEDAPQESGNNTVLYVVIGVVGLGAIGGAAFFIIKKRAA